MNSVNPLNEEVTDETALDDALNDGGLAIAVFVMDWHDFPGIMELVQNALVRETRGLNTVPAIKVLINSGLAEKYSVPEDTSTIVLFKQSKEVARTVGFAKEEEILPWLKQEGKKALKEMAHLHPVQPEKTRAARTGEKKFII